MCSYHDNVTVYSYVVYITLQLISHSLCYAFELSSAAAWVASWTKPFPFSPVVNLEAFHVKPFNTTIDIFTPYHT